MAWLAALGAASLGASLGLGGCARASIEEPLFPLVDGRSWTYRVVTAWDDPLAATQRETMTLTARGPEMIEGAPTWRRRSDSGVEYWLRQDATGVYRVASKGPLDRFPLADSERRYVLAKPHQVGTEWRASTTTYLLQRRNEVPREVRHTHKSFPMTYRIDALGESVETPAGRFDGCVRVAGSAEIRLYVEAQKAIRPVPLHTREWYCPGVGLAKLERHEAAPSRFMIGGTMTLELTRWQ